MKLQKILFLIVLSVIWANCLSQPKSEEKRAIKEVILESYLGGAYNDNDVEAIKKGFHESFTTQVLNGNMYRVIPLQEWINGLNDWKKSRKNWNNNVTAEITVIGLEGNAAVAQVELFNKKIHQTTEFLSIYKFNDQWKITNKIFFRQLSASGTHRMGMGNIENQMHGYQHTRETGDQNLKRQAEQVMDAVGVKSGMIIGEIGAGAGRYTIHLAQRVGREGKILANDIYEDKLSLLREKCRKNNINNVETILATIDDPKFPDKTLDMAIMVLVYHMLENPVALLKNLKPSLKPGSKVIIFEPAYERMGQDDSHKMSMRSMGSMGKTTKEKLKEEAEKAGFELLEVKTFLPINDIYVLKIKS